MRLGLLSWLCARRSNLHDQNHSVAKLDMKHKHFHDFMISMLFLFLFHPIIPDRLAKFEAIISDHMGTSNGPVTPSVCAIMFFNSSKPTSCCLDLELGGVRWIWTLSESLNGNYFPFPNFASLSRLQIRSFWLIQHQFFSIQSADQIVCCRKFVHHSPIPKPLLVHSRVRHMFSTLGRSALFPRNSHHVESPPEKTEPSMFKFL